MNIKMQKKTKQTEIDMETRREIIVLHVSKEKNTCDHGFNNVNVLSCT